MAVIPSKVCAAEYTGSVDTPTFDIGLNQELGSILFHEEIRQVVRDGLKEGIKKGIEDAGKNDGMSWGTIAKVGGGLVVVGGGSFLLFQWLRSQYATPEDSRKKDEHVNQYLTEKLNDLQKLFREKLGLVASDVDSIGADAEELVSGVKGIGRQVDDSAKKYSQIVSQACSGLDSRASNCANSFWNMHLQRMRDIESTGKFWGAELGTLDTNPLSESVAQLGGDMSSHARAMQQAFELQQKDQLQQHTELLSNLEGLAQTFPMAQTTVSQNGKNLQKILAGIKFLQGSGKKVDEQLKYFGENYAYILDILSQQGQEQKTLITNVEAMHGQLDVLIGALLLEPGQHPHAGPSSSDQLQLGWQR